MSLDAWGDDDAPEDAPLVTKACPDCRGLGIGFTGDGERVVCETCEGTGEVIVPERSRFE